jgi:hypothetical protein
MFSVELRFDAATSKPKSTAVHHPDRRTQRSFVISWQTPAPLQDRTRNAGTRENVLSFTSGSAALLPVEHFLALYDRWR